MNPEILYSVMNALPMPVWLCWMFAPKSRASRYLATALWPWALLAAVYLALICVSMFVVDGSPEASMATLRGVMAIFDSPWSTMAGWAHYLCFDLFAARWIMNDAPDAGYKLFPILVFTLMFGPVGLLMYIAARPKLRTS